MFKSIVTRIAATALFVGAVASCGGSDSDSRVRNGMVIRQNNSINNCLNDNVTNMNNSVCDIDNNLANNNIINITTTTIGSANVSTTTLQPNGEDVAQQNSATTTTNMLASTTTVVSNDISNSMASCSITVTSTKLSACKAVTKVVYRLKRGTATVASGIKEVAPASKSLAYSQKSAKTPTKGTLTISFADGTSTAVSIGKFDGKAITVYPK